VRMRGLFMQNSKGTAAAGVDPEGEKGVAPFQGEGEGAAFRSGSMI